MQTIVKENGQIFEIYASKKEFASMVKDLFDGKVWTDDDSSLSLEFKDGSTLSLFAGDTIPRYNASNIVSGHYSNPCTNAIYNCSIVHNGRYDDYEIA